MTHPRNLIVVEDEGQASVIEDYVSFGDEAPAFSNAVTELVAGGNANVQHIMLEREHLQTYNFSTLRIQQARSANVASHSAHCNRCCSNSARTDGASSPSRYSDSRSVHWSLIVSSPIQMLAAEADEQPVDEALSAFSGEHGMHVVTHERPAQQ